MSRVRVGPLLLALLAAIVSGCGGGADDPDGAGATTTTAARTPQLARAAAASGEIVIRGESSPQSHGPYELRGSYLVRFEQHAPEDPRLDFAAQTPFSAALVRRAGDTRGSMRLFEQAARTGQRELRVRGRYVVDVSFGDFPYVLRFTPRG